MSKGQTPSVMPQVWLDWNFKADENPFNEAMSSVEVRTKQNKIENYLRTELLNEGGPSWSVHCTWTVTHSNPKVYNMQATLIQAESGTEAAFTAFASTSIGTPQPPPQPPPPNL